MKALATFNFQYDNTPVFENGRSFLITFEVEPSEALGLKLNEDDDEFYDRLVDMVRGLDIHFAVDWPVGNATSFGWLTNCHDEREDPLLIVQKVRDFFLAEGFSGGGIQELTEEEWATLEDNDDTNLKLLAAIAALRKPLQGQTHP